MLSRSFCQSSATGSGSQSLLGIGPVVAKTTSSRWPDLEPKAAQDAAQRHHNIMVPGLQELTARQRCSLLLGGLEIRPVDRQGSILILQTAEDDHLGIAGLGRHTAAEGCAAFIGVSLPAQGDGLGGNLLGLKSLRSACDW
jgi:hypothetical protein